MEIERHVQIGPKRIKRLKGSELSYFSFMQYIAVLQNLYVQFRLNSGVLPFLITKF
jgi:hypothetical protein